MKVLYYFGQQVDGTTIVSRGTLQEEAQSIYLEGKEKRYAFDRLQKVDLVKINGLGTMVKVQNGSDTVFLAAFRIFIDLGSGFAITNYGATRKLAKALRRAMGN